MEEIAFENYIIPPGARWRMRRGANAITRGIIDERWGVGWKAEFGPADRVLAEEFLTQLSAMAGQGWGSAVCEVFWTVRMVMVGGGEGGWTDPRANRLRKMLLAMAIVIVPGMK